MAQEKYDARGLEGELRDLLGTARLSQAMVPLLIPAYDIERREPMLFRSDDPNGTGEDYFLWQVCRATMSTASYFEPARAENLNGPGTRTLVGGSVFAKNPALHALAAAVDSDVAQEEVLVVSLGNGQQTRPFEYRDVKTWGRMNWISPANGVPIDSVIAHGQSESVERQMQSLLKEIMHMM